MLMSMHIENIAIISKLDVDFSGGFTVMTGETGAGKSIIIDALNLILGGRTAREIIREGASGALVTAYFDNVDLSLSPECADYNIRTDEDGGLMIRREITADGRSSAKVNGATVPVSALKLLARSLVNIHGQHDSQALLNPDNHINYLDFMSDEIPALMEQYTQIYTALTSMRHEINDLSLDEREKQRQIEMLKFQIEDINSVNPKTGEEEKLESEKKRLSNIEKVSKSVTTAIAALSGGGERAGSASDYLRKAIAALNPISDIIESAPDDIERLKSYIYELEDIVDNLSPYSETEGDPTTKLDKIEGRLEQIYRLKRKYGSGIEQIQQFKQSAQERLEGIMFSDEKINALKEQYAKKESEAKAVAEKLSHERKKASVILQKRVKEELSWLDMPKVIFEALIKKTVETTGGYRYTRRGVDTVEFLIATNVGEVPKPMEKIASGGELSRIMLALKSVLAEKDKVGTLIFDEIDTGISGKTSQKIGVKLKAIARGPQVICVTHSAQIAALADTHLKISKRELDGRAHTSLENLTYDQRVEELSRITGGIEITDTLRQNAREMLAEAEKY